MNREFRVFLATSKGNQEFVLPDKKSETSLADNLASRGSPLNTRCGQKGICKGCVVKLISGRLTMNSRIIEAPAEIRSCQCQAIPSSVLSLEIPPRSLMSYNPRIMSDFAIGIPFSQDPLFNNVERDVKRFGLAVDLGTTTVVVLLVDLQTGKILAQASDFNAQIHLGDDVLTRIQLCSVDPATVVRMQEAVVGNCLVPLIRQVIAQENVSFDCLAGMIVSGNTTMLHLLAGEDPTPMGVVPFTPRFLNSRRLQSNSIGFDFDRNENDSNPFEICLLPGLAAYVGADLTAGIYATGMHYSEAPTLLTDIGTNGEIILKYGENLWGCATAAGPAFEGAGLSCGMRAVEGVISRIAFPDPLKAPVCEVIGQRSSGRQPLGICGSAYLDFLAEGRRIGLLDGRGRFEPAFCESLPPGYILNMESGKAFSLLPNLKEPITISEQDIAQLLQAKSAIAAGMEILLKRAGINTSQVEKLYLAGGFGFNVDIPNAIACGLLPGLNPRQVEVVGNSALAGAYICLLDRNALVQMETIRQRIEIIELNLDPDFEDRYINHLSLP